MARPCEFDRAEAVAKAVELFLQQGYEATSIDDITSRLGISRASLYNAFGDKRGLLLASFCHAAEQNRETRVDALSCPGPVREVLRSFFQSLTKGQGCFFLTLGAELACLDTEVQARVRGALEETQAALADLIRRGQSAGEVSPAKDPDRVAAALVGSMTGLLTLSRVYRSEPVLASVTDHALAALD